MGMFDEIKSIFERACESNIMCTCQTYFDVLDFYFKAGRYDEVTTMLKIVPELVAEDDRATLFGFEAERKLRKYDDVIEKIDEFLKQYDAEEFDDDNHIRARTIRAYCMMHCGRELDALGEFSILKGKVNRDNVHYPRILCGFVFTRPVLSDSEKEQVLAELDFFKAVVGPSMYDKVVKSIKKLDDASQVNS